MILATIDKHPAKYDCLKHPVILQLESLNFTPFHLIALTLFVLAIIHTLSASKIHNWARALEIKQKHHRHGKKGKERSCSVALFSLSS